MLRMQRSQNLPLEQVGRQGQVAERGQPVRVRPDVRVQPERLVDHHHARPRARRGRAGTARYAAVAPTVTSGTAGPYTLRQPGTQVPSSVTV